MLKPRHWVKIYSFFCIRAHVMLVHLPGICGLPESIKISSHATLSRLDVMEKLRKAKHRFIWLEPSKSAFPRGFPFCWKANVPFLADVRELIQASASLALIAARWTQALMNVEELSLCRCQGANHGVVWVVWYANDSSLGKQPKKRYPKKGVVVWFVYMFLYVSWSFPYFSAVLDWPTVFCYGCLRSP